MFRTVRLSIIRSSFTVHSAMVYVIQVCRQLSSRSICSCSKTGYKPAWYKPLLSLQWINSWWWTDELPETCKVSWQNKFVKLVQSSWFYYEEINTLTLSQNLMFADHVAVCSVVVNIYTICFSMKDTPNFSHTVYLFRTIIGVNIDYFLYCLSFIKETCVFTVA